MSWIAAAQTLTLYSGIILFIGGIFGNLMNIYIFSSAENYRTTPTTFYLLITSICNCIYILLNLIPRILTTTYGIQIAKYSVVWCKLQQYFISVFNLSSLTFTYLSTIDQYLATSRHAAFRRCSNIKWTQRIVLAVLIVAILHSFPFLIFYDIAPPNNNCAITSPIFATYAASYVLGLLWAAPVLLTSIFGFLTYRNISQTVGLAEQHADRQLVRMIFIQVFLVVISIAPYGINATYGLITAGIAKDINQQMKEYFISILVIMLSYLYYSGNFYIFLASSSRFRGTVRDRIVFFKKNNQIQPSTTIRTR